MESKKKIAKVIGKLTEIILLLCFFSMIACSQNDTSGSYENEPFTGVVRGRTKTTISKGSLRSYPNVQSFLKSLPPDSHMRSLGIKNNSPRLIEEDYNILVEKASIFGMSLEEDGDVHIVIGDWDTEISATYIVTAEISGLPDALFDSYAELKKSRTDFYAEFPFFKTKKYVTYKSKSKSPVVTIKGSLFFDHYHTPDNSSEAQYRHKPKTSFEIHPVTSIRRID
ncbi:MAG: hypothetical protein ACOYOA_03575 [Saprospiraceae bacterium]